MKQFMILVLLIFSVALTITISNGINDVLNAKAEKERLIARQKELDMEFRRSIEIEKEKERVALWNETFEYRVIAVGGMIIILAAMVSIVVIMSGSAFGLYTIRMGAIKVEEARFKSMLVHPDGKTGLYPLLFDNPSNPRFLVDANTGGVWKLDARTEPNELMIAGRERVQVAGVLPSNGDKYEILMEE